VRLLRFGGKKARLRALTEAECYGRAYGDPRQDILKVVKAEPRRPRYTLPVSGEHLRSAFAERLEAREVE
jgi:hypothetical protein